MDARDRFVLIELRREAVGLDLVFGRGRRGPPIAQAPAGIILPAFIVIAVAHFVADRGRAGLSIIDGGIGIGVEERRLQDRGRNRDLVHRRVVISVHRLRGHFPQGPSTGCGKRLSSSCHWKFSVATSFASGSVRLI